MIAWLKYCLLYIASLLGIERRRPVGVCPFCDIMQKEAYRVLKADDLAIVVLAEYQVRPGHLLVIPRRHVISFRELTETELYRLSWWLQWTAEKLVEAKIADGINLAINDGETAGQTVQHVHAHVLPRRKGDLRLPYVWANPMLLFSGAKLKPQAAPRLIEMILKEPCPTKNPQS